MCSTGETVMYCAAAARDTVISVSPVESDTRCRWKKLATAFGAIASAFTGLLWTDVEKATPRPGTQACQGPAGNVRPHPHRWGAFRQAGFAHVGNHGNE